MPEFIFGLGKGLREPCSPYREAYFFGAELNEPNADNWNCLPGIVEPTTSFDLSSISEGKEVLVALLGVGRTVAGTYHIRFRWYRDRDDALLYDYTFDPTVPAGYRLYGYSYIGWVSWEINENGGYVVEIDVTGAESFTKKIPFTVSGIPEEEPEPIPEEGFFPAIISYVLSIASYFLSLKEEVEDWVWPFYHIAPFFLYIADAFARLAYRFELFSDWVDFATDRVEDILNLTEITLALKTWLDYATWAWNWVANAWSNVRSIIEDWWGSKIPIIYGWIAIATEGLVTLEVAWDNFWAITFPYWTSKLDNLKATWDNFWTVTFPTLVSFTWLTIWWNDRVIEVQSWINSAFIEREPFWAGWQDIRDKVFEFFDDPLEWLLNRFTDWFLGPEV